MGGRFATNEGARHFLEAGKTGAPEREAASAHLTTNPGRHEPPRAQERNRAACCARLSSLPMPRETRKALAPVDDAIVLASSALVAIR